MRKMIIGATLLIVLFGASLYNTFCFSKKMEQIEGYIRASYVLSVENDKSGAKTLGRQANEIWEQSEVYTHIFLRHSEVDDLSVAMFNYLEGVDESSYQELIYRINTIVKIEKPSLGSIF